VSFGSGRAHASWRPDGAPQATQSDVPRRAVLIVALTAALGMSGCKIVRDSDKAALDPSDPNNFNAKAYVDAMWDRKVVTYFDERAKPIAQVLDALAKNKDSAGAKFGHRAGDEGSPWTFAVRGSGKVKSVNAASRHGELVLEIAAPGHSIDATLQIGPVIFGTAVRDALPFIAFGDFQNQIQYAEVSRALNDRASAQAHAGLTPAPRVGSTLEFVGAMTDPSMTGDTTVTVLRVRPAGVSLK
jgi:predicted lipoprotein